MHNVYTVCKRLLLLFFVCAVLSAVLIINSQGITGYRYKSMQDSVEFKNPLDLQLPIKSVVTNRRNCSEKNVTLSDKPLPLTGLMSFPGSGNTWTRHLIQQFTGLATSSVYCDKTLKINGFPYECVRGNQQKRTVVVKTHDPQHHKMFSKIVFLIRNPYEAFLSRQNFVQFGHIKYPNETQIQAQSQQNYKGSVLHYQKLVNAITDEFHGQVLVLQYEKLKSDLIGELRRLSDFLDVPVSNHDIECTANLQEGNFHRNYTDFDRLKRVKMIYSKDRLLEIKTIARSTEKKLKDKFGVSLDLGGNIEDKLFD